MRFQDNLLTQEDQTIISSVTKCFIYHMVLSQELFTSVFFFNFFIWRITALQYCDGLPYVNVNQPTSGFNIKFCSSFCF